MLSGLQRSRLTAVAAVVALLAVFQVPAFSLLHGLGGDDACDESFIPHDASAHGMRAAKQAVAPHCAICHWWQSAGRFNGSRLPSTAILIVDYGLVSKPPIAAPDLALSVIRSVRAPPAA